jgi:hypothetical protein
MDMDIDELISTAVDQQPTRFASVFDNLMGQKIAARLEDERISYAQKMFADPEDAEDADEDYDDYEDDVDFDIDDDEFDDDFDLDDLDLEDLDTEEEDDDGEDA